VIKVIVWLLLLISTGFSMPTSIIEADQRLEEVGTDMVEVYIV
jgi:hypothetical protein